MHKQTDDLSSSYLDEFESISKKSTILDDPIQMQAGPMENVKTCNFGIEGKPIPIFRDPGSSHPIILDNSTISDSDSVNSTFPSDSSVSDLASLEAAPTLTDLASSLKTQASDSDESIISGFLSNTSFDSANSTLVENINQAGLENLPWGCIAITSAQALFGTNGSFLSLLGGFLLLGLSKDQIFFELKVAKEDAVLLYQNRHKIAIAAITAVVNVHLAGTDNNNPCIDEFI